MADVEVVRSENLSSVYDMRYVIVDKNTGEVLDDAQGYGYRTVQGAYKAYAYKTRDRSKDKEKAQRRKEIRSWMKQHKGFVRAEDKFDARFVKKMLKDNGLAPDFSAGELLKVWRGDR